MRVSVVVFTLCFFNLSLPAVSSHDAECEQTKRICVIGAGIGAAASSFYIRNRSLSACGGNAHVNITVFESRDYIGGRLKHIEFGPQRAKIEVGGAAWMSSNLYIRQLAAAVGMNASLFRKNRINGRRVDESKDKKGFMNSDQLNDFMKLSKKIGVWQGDAFADVLPIFMQHLPSVVKVANAESKFLQRIAKNYVESQAAQPFTSIPDFIAFGSLEEFTNASISEFFSQISVADTVVDNMLVPLNRAIYNQNSEASAFSVLASMAALLDHEDCPSGNSDLVEALFAAANATVKLSTKVISVEHSGTQFAVTYKAGSSQAKSELFDSVLIAAPLEVTGIQFPQMKLPAGASIDRQFKPWHVTIVEADRLNASQFSMPDNDSTLVPEIILTSAHGSTEKTPWVCIQPVGKHGKNGTDDKDVYMVYSDDDIRERLHGELFEGVRNVYYQYWPYTFGQLKPFSYSANVQPIVLAPGLYNLNAMESLGSAMEISCIGAHNGARLASEFLWPSNQQDKCPQPRWFKGIEVHDMHPFHDMMNDATVHSPEACYEKCCQVEGCRAFMFTTNQSMPARNCSVPNADCCWLKPTVNLSRLTEVCSSCTSGIMGSVHGFTR